MTGAQFIARVYQVLGLPATHPDVTNGVIADNFCARLDEFALLVKPPMMRTQVSRAVVANSQTIYLPADHLQTIKIRLADANGNYSDLTPQTQEDLDAVSPDWQDGDSGTITGYSYAGIVSTPGANSYGQRILKLSAVPTTSDSDGLLLRYWVRGSDLITGTNSQYQIVQVPRMFHLGLVHGVAGLIATDPRLNRDPIAHLQIWQDMVQRAQHLVPEHREYDYPATAYTGVQAGQSAFWAGL